MNLLAILSPIFWGLLVLSLLVFVHEAGHYGMARLCGVRVTEFFLGMPFKYKLSHKSKKYGTEVGVTPLLFGGYTRICGMEGQLDELLPQALMSVQEAGSLEVGTLAAKLNCEDDRAYNLLYTLADWGSIE
ncbi:MAG: site-2 protease family protein, partial [Lancefieldella parvula]|nr:site-2 protease family protein [Lancefieldella parvula]